MDLTQRVVEYFNEVFLRLYSKTVPADEKRKPTCDPGLFSWWNCCVHHRLLRALHEELSRIADELDAAFNLDGVTHAYLEASRLGKDISGLEPKDPRAPQVGSQAWLEKLSRGSRVPLPNQKPAWWQ